METNCVRIECIAGYELSQDGQSCVDTNECELGTHDCGIQQCINTSGSFVCDICPKGFELDNNGKCVDINECATGIHYCGNNPWIAPFTDKPVCENTEGAYTCNCDAGLTFSTEQCQTEIHNGVPHEVCTYAIICSDINECDILHARGITFEGYQCNNLLSGYQCEHHRHGVYQTLGDHCCEAGYDIYSFDGRHDCIPIVCQTGYKLNDEGNLCIDVDECTDECPERMHNCRDYEVCSNTFGSYTCDRCPAGYEADLFGNCHDINECKLNGGHSCGHGLCINTEGSFACDCARGYESNSYRCNLQRLSSGYNMRGFQPHWICTSEPYCVDIDECALGIDHCRVDYGCINAEKGFYCCDYDQTNCECPANYALEEPISNGDTPRCIHIECTDGFEMDPTGQYCSDINECETVDFCKQFGSDHCGNRLAQLGNPNLAGNKFECLNCPDGYVMKNGTCTDYNECINPSSKPRCLNGACINTDASYECDCPNELTQTIVGCEVVREPVAEHLFSFHHPHNVCDDTKICTDLNECLTSPCPNERECMNLQPGFACWNSYLGTTSYMCPPGYSMRTDGHTCLTIVCDVGYELDFTGAKCVDVNECEQANICDTDEFCINSKGSYSCSNCPLGYEIKVINGQPVCKDFNECTNVQHDCDPVYGECVNTDGSYTCNCFVGFEVTQPQRCTINYNYTAELPPHDWIFPHEDCVDKPICTDINECKLGIDNCRVDYHCGNTTPGFKCCNIYPFLQITTYFSHCECGHGYAMENGVLGQDNRDGLHCYAIECSSGYELRSEGDYCIDIDECAIGTDNCDDGLHCLNHEGGFQCLPCARGYELINGLCTDINECDVDNIDCIYGNCVNTDGSYTCSCNYGAQLRQANDCEIHDFVPKPLDSSSTQHPHETCVESITCVDIDECQDVNSYCATNETCRDRQPFFSCCYGETVNGAYTHVCNCPTGYSIANNRTLWEHNTYGLCLYTECANGYEQNDKGDKCIDIDECLENPCDDEQYCHNTNGGYSCIACPYGYEEVNGECVDIDECATDVNGTLCGKAVDFEEGLGDCVNTIGSYTCDCFSGFALVTPARRCTITQVYMDYFQVSNPYDHENCVTEPLCENVNECNIGTDNCPLHLECTDMDPSSMDRTQQGYGTVNLFKRAGHFRCCDQPERYYYYTRDCECPPGYDILGTKKINYELMDCQPIVCNTGYEMNVDGTACTDINECELGTHTCNEADYCINNDGSFVCQACPNGYEMIESSAEGNTCEDINECEVNTEVCGFGQCTNTEGSYDCLCDPGFETTQQRCQVRDRFLFFFNEIRHRLHLLSHL